MIGVFMKEYYEKTKGRSTRPLLMEFLKYIPSDVSNHTAYDLGCGVGNDTNFMSENGYRVKAVDISADAFVYMNKKFGKLEHVEQIVSSLEDLTLEPCNLVNASLVLPFVKSSDFDVVLERIAVAIKSKGFFVGNFFGPKDDWKNKFVVKSVDEVKSYVKSFDILYIKETEVDAPSAGGPVKHWHIIDIICQKK